jgi:hypothetical protein
MAPNATDHLRLARSLYCRRSQRGEHSRGERSADGPYAKSGTDRRTVCLSGQIGNAGLPLKPRFWPVPEIGLRSEMVHLVASNSGRPVGARSQHSPGVGSTQTKLHARRAAYILLTDRLFFTFQGGT